MKKVLSLYFLLLSFTILGQENQPWRSFFSYNDIVDVTESPSKVFGAAGSAIFEKNLGNNNLKTITSVDGLKVETITAIHHSSAFNRTLVGNSNGLLLVIKGDNTIVNKIGIVQETTVAAAKKKINSIYEYEGKAYIACDFGIAVFNLETLEFGDTYYLGPNGSEAAVSQCTIANGIIYAACTNDGIRSASIANPNLNDYNQWQQLSAGQWTGAVTYAGGACFSDTNGTLFRLINGNLISFVLMPSQIVDLRVANGYMIVTSSNVVHVYNPQLTLAAKFDYWSLPENMASIFTCATVTSETLFIGTQSKGMIAVGFNGFNPENITPNGPERSNIFSLEKTPNALWAVFGGYSYTYEPDYSEYGVSKFNTKGWSTIPYSKLNGTKSISDITVSPANENLVYLNSFHSGLLKVENDEATLLYNQSNSTLESQMFVPGFTNVRVNAGVFDKAGNLWVTNSMTEKALKVLKPNGQWGTSYSFKNLTQKTITDNYSKMVIDKNGTKWIASLLNGVIGFNETLNNKLIVITEGQNGNLPSYTATCVAIDNNNRLWIGTNKGLRVLPGIDRFSTENELTTNPIIIMEDGLAQELMYEQGIIDIVVDGANNKWIGTANAGAFLVSPDGQQTLFHFTKENSPLPSNSINDIEIDNASGEVFFATDKGMVSYKGTSTEAATDLSKVYVFPNPVRPGFEGDVNISALIDKANIKITDIEGNLVFETTSEGGTVLWDTRAFGKYKVASGVYMIFISSEDGTQTKVKKVMIIR